MTLPIIMNKELTDLYQQLIIDHGQNPRNFYVLEGPDFQAKGFNPLCGDSFIIFLKMNGDVIQEISFQGKGCAISTASASLMTECLKGKTRKEAKDLFEDFRQFLMEDSCSPNPNNPVAAGFSLRSFPSLEKLQVLGGVRQFPSRIKCATLAWHTLHSLIMDKPK